MPGFFITNSSSPIDKLNNHTTSDCIEGAMQFDGYTILRNTLNKFIDDKPFFENENYVVIIEGVILNKVQLMSKYSCTTFRETLTFLIKEYGDTFYNNFRGSFSGALYLKSEKRWIVYTNQTGEKQVFYYQEGAVVIIGSQVNYILDQIRRSNRKVSLDQQAVYSMITYMFVCGNHTFASEIRRLSAGKYLSLKNENDLETYTYHTFNHSKYDVSKQSDDELINEINKRMMNATKLEFDKDLEYGYRHCADLSGGFDCRMTSWIARELGYQNIVNLHYSQNGCSDEIVTKKIANTLKNQLVTMSLSDISFIFDIKRNTEMLHGLSMYCSSTGANRMLDVIDMSHFGIEHTGMLGDVIIGTFLDDVENPTEKKPRKVISNKVLDKLDHSYLEGFEDAELQLLYTRGMNGALNSSTIRQNYTEISAPFLDVEVFEYCICIPYQRRANRRLYDKWVMKYYPEAAQIENASSGRRITSTKMQVLMNKALKAPRRLAQKLKISTDLLNEGMNPYMFWWNTDKRFPMFVNEYFENNINNSILTDEVRDDLVRVFDGSASNSIVGIYEKLSVISILAAINYYFDDCENTK